MAAGGQWWSAMAGRANTVGGAGPSLGDESRVWAPMRSGTGLGHAVETISVGRANMRCLTVLDIQDHE